MRTGLGITALCCLLAGTAARAQIPAFPGAEGYGAYATGGRGGDVYHVTTLNSSGPGSFADALATAPSAGRTIVFDVSGYIRFPSGSDGTRLTASKITIAGQTAPGDGVGFYNNFLRISGDDVVIRHVRFRYGRQTAGGDCVDLDSGCNNAMLDHVSMEFSTDENMSSFDSPPENLTLQYSLNSWGLESHSCGGLWDQNHATAHHNLWSHNHTRNPKARPSGLLEWVNNVTFDWDIGFIMGDSQSVYNWRANVIGNYFICPPGNTRSKALVKGTVADNGRPNFTVHLSGNLIDNDGDGALDGTDQGYSIVEGTAYSGAQTGTPGTLGYVQSAAPLAGSTAGVTTDSALLAYKKIVSNAGALRLDASHAGGIRDEVDTLLINALKALARFHVTRESDTGASNYGWGVLGSTLPLADTDRDGIPDLYEGAAGMNAASDDHNAVFSGTAIATGSTFFPTNSPSGYTYLEEYLHFKASPHTYVAKNTAGAPTYADIDLARYTGGFTRPAVTFAVTHAAGGSVAILGDGHTVRFTPTVDFSGRARFDFTVTDGDGSSWTQRFHLIVTTAGIPKNLLWRGDGTSNAWDATAANWWNGTVPAAFGEGDTVTFDDTGFNSPAVSVRSTVSPASFTVNADRNYTLSGTGGIAGATSLLKAGTGTLTLAVNTSYAGGTDLEGGSIVLSKPGDLGSGPVAVNGRGTITSTYPNSGSSDNLFIGGDITVPAGSTLSVNLSQRSQMGGAIGGGGTLNINAPSTTGTEGRDYLDSPMAATFTGTLNVSGGGAGRLAVRENGGNFDGFDHTRLNLTNANLFCANNSYGGTYRIGSLSGNSGAAIRGCYNAGGNATTWIIGGLGLDDTFAGAIQDGVASVTKVLKEGPGTLVLSGTNSYTGATTLSNGTLVVNGVLGATPVTVAGGTTLAGGGVMAGDVTVQSGAVVAPGSAPGTAGTLAAGTNLSLTSPTLCFDLSGSPAGTNDRLTLSGGLLTMSGTQTYQFNLLDGVLGAGTYMLIEGGANTSAGGVGLVHNLPANVRQSFALQRPASGNGQCYVRLVVAGNAASLVWTGTNAAGAVWDNTLVNWANGPAADRFYDLDAVTFDTTSTNGNVTIAAPLAPRAVTVTNTTTPYTFGGAGSIGGRASLVKSGTGTLWIHTSNSFAGGTVIRGGTVQLGSVTANAFGLGGGAVTFEGGTLAMYDNTGDYNGETYHLAVLAGQTGTLHADSRCDLYGTLTGGGTLNVRVPWVRTALYADWSAFTGRIHLITDGDGGDLRMAGSYAYPGFPNASVHLADRVSLYYIGTLAQGAGTTISIGELSGGALSGLLGGPTGGRNFTYRIGGKTAAGGEVTFAGSIAEQNADTTTSLVKTGAGTWILGGTCRWNGGTTVEAGILRIGGSVVCGGAVHVLAGARLDLAGGSLTADAVNVSSNATLSGSGSIVGDLNNDGTLTCESGMLNVTGNIVNNGTMRFTGGSGLVEGGGATFVNNGLLDLISGLPSLPENFENHGIVLDGRDVTLTAASLREATFRVSIAGYTGHNYQLQRRASLVSGAWENIGAAQAGNQGARLDFTDSSSAGAQGYYRILVSP